MCGNFHAVFPIASKPAVLLRAVMVVAMFWWSVGAASAQPGAFQIESASKQFVVIGPPGLSTPMMVPIGKPSKDLIRLTRHLSPFHPNG